jgi:antitoxin ParD1/3/4
MSDLTRRTVTLSKTQSDYIDAKIATGEFVSASEVVRAGLAALTQRDAMVTQWLEREVISVYTAASEDPKRLKSSEETFAEMRAYMATKLGKAAA